jgi:RNA polymerase sigma factor (sigma-70 family)
MPPVRYAGEVPEAGVSEQRLPEPEPFEQLPPEWRAEIEECYRATAPKVYRVLLRFGQGDHELAAALVQETFREATRKWSELRAMDEEIRTGWLIRVAVNRAIDVFRHGATERRKRPQVRMRYESAETNVHEEVMTAIAMEQFIKVLNKMPRQQARVAFLYWRCEWTNSEIAAALSITRGAVSQHITKARATLRRELGPYVPFEPREPEGGACS